MAWRNTCNECLLLFLQFATGFCVICLFNMIQSNVFLVSDEIHGRPAIGLLSRDSVHISKPSLDRGFTISPAELREQANSHPSHPMTGLTVESAH